MSSSLFSEGVALSLCNMRNCGQTRFTTLMIMHNMEQEIQFGNRLVMRRRGTSAGERLYGRSTVPEQVEGWEVTQPPVQWITPDGQLTGEHEQLDVQALTDMYRQMMLARVFDRKAIRLQRQGRIGTYAPFEGQEAAQIGSAVAIRQQDWVFPTYRDHAALLTCGHDPVQLLLYWMGRLEGGTMPKDRHILPPSVPIATQMLHAVGAAWAAKLKREDVCALAYFGDGASSEGDFHEALNFAGVFQVPVVFFCQNNGYAISVPFERQSASATIAERGAAYNIPGIRVDGNDVLAVYHVTREAVQRAAAGGGPTLIEAVTFRYGSHTTADDAAKYREQKQLVAYWRERDPLTRVQTLLIQADAWDDAREQACWQEAERNINGALKRAEAYPKPDPALMFEHVTAEKNWRVREQQQAWRSVNNGVQGAAGEKRVKQT